MEYQREVDGGVLVFGVGKEKVDGDGVVSLAVGEGNLIVEADRTYILSSGEVSLKSWKA